MFIVLVYSCGSGNRGGGASGVATMLVCECYGEQGGIYLGEAQNVVARPCNAGDSPAIEVISDTECPCLIRGEKRSLLIKVNPGNPTALAAIKASDPTNDWSAVGQQINSIQADLYETPFLALVKSLLL